MGFLSGLLVGAALATIPNLGGHDLLVNRKSHDIAFGNSRSPFGVAAPGIDDLSPIVARRLSVPIPSYNAPACGDSDICDPWPCGSDSDSALSHPVAAPQPFLVTPCDLFLFSHLTHALPSPLFRLAVCSPMPPTPPQACGDDICEPFPCGSDGDICSPLPEVWPPVYSPPPSTPVASPPASTPEDRDMFASDDTVNGFPAIVAIPIIGGSCAAVVLLLIIVACISSHKFSGTSTSPKSVEVIPKAKEGIEMASATGERDVGEGYVVGETPSTTAVSLGAGAVELVDESDKV